MLDAQHAGDDHTRIVEEMGVWSRFVRIDIAVINGKLHGFDLMSARDTLDRLPKQAAFYNQVSDRVTFGGREQERAQSDSRCPAMVGHLRGGWFSCCRR